MLKLINTVIPIYLFLADRILTASLQQQVPGIVG